jgi:hypothetical protein
VPLVNQQNFELHLMPCISACSIIITAGVLEIDQWTIDREK